MNSISFALAGQNMALALATGLAVGIERQHSNRDKANRLYGLRDYMLIAVLSFLSSLFHEEVPMVWLLTFVAVVIYSIMVFIFEHLPANEENRSGGLTSIMVMPFTFLTASLPNFGVPFWILATIMFVVLLFLNLKTQFHTFGASITQREISDFAILIGIAISITPLIPADAQIPIPLVHWVDGVRKMHYNHISIAMLWKVVTMVSLMSFTAHFITKYIRGRNALVLATFFGGLVSSLATIMLLLEDKPAGPDGEKTSSQLTTREMFLGFVAANTGSILKDVVVFRLVIGDEMFAPFIFPMTSCLVLFGAISAYVFTSQQAEAGGAQEIVITNRPLPLKFIFKFTTMFAGLILAMGMITFYLGTGATVIASFFSGMASSAAALGAVGTSMLQGSDLSGWVAGLSVIAALMGSLSAKYLVILKKLGFQGSKIFLLPLVSLLALGLVTTWMTFQKVG